MKWPWNKAPKEPEQQVIVPAIPSNSLWSSDFKPEPIKRKTPREKLIEKQKRSAALAATFQKGSEHMVAQDAAGKQLDFAMDSADGSLTTAKLINSSTGIMPLPQLEFFSNQGFIGWQLCAVLAQNWLIDKACTVPADDAIRNGWDIASGSNEELDPKTLQIMKRLDKKYDIKRQCRQFVKQGRIFGVRHALYLVDGIDYSAPFNPDGVRPGSYRGISQIDPYWMAPVLDASAAADPAAQDFYEPTWWQIGSRRIHRSHFCIMRNGDELPDLLKPSYIYGGIPTPQKIFERVYAAERCANESPMLLMTKRLTALKLDLTAAAAQQDEVREKMEWWVALRDNYGVKLIGTGDELEQFDTTLADVDDVLWQQFELVAAASDMPGTKLLGKTPGGMNATGQYDEKSYHEMLESMQEHDITPLLDGHYIRMIRSDVLPILAATPADPVEPNTQPGVADAPKRPTKPFAVEVAWIPTDSPTALELAELNLKKAQTGTALANNGAIDGTDERQRIANDPHSGYNGIDEIVPGGPGDREHQQEMEEEQRELDREAIASGNANDGESM